MVADLEDMTLVLGNVLRVADLDGFFLGSDQPDELDRLQSVDLAHRDVLVVAEAVLDGLDVRVLRGNREGVDNLGRLLRLLGQLSVDGLVFSCEGQNVFFKVSKDYLLDSIVLFDRKLFAIVKLSVYTLSKCESFELFTILKEVA